MAKNKCLAVSNLDRILQEIVYKKTRSKHKGLPRDSSNCQNNVIDHLYLG